MMNIPASRTLCVLGLSALLMSSAAVLSVTEQPAAAAAPVEIGDTSATPLPAYLVREHEGLVAVFSGDGALLLNLTDAPVAALPQADRQDLQAGIPVASAEALAMLLEDYQ